MRARLPWGSLSMNNSEFWSPSSAGKQLLKEGTPFSYNAGNLSSSKFAYQHVFLMALSELWLSQILACVFIHCCIWPSRTLSRNKINGTIPVSLTGLPNLINLLLDSNNLNSQIPQTLFQIPKYNFTGNNLNCGVGQLHPCVSEVARSGDSSKPKTGIIPGVTVVLFGILVFLFCRDTHKGYKRDVFVDVAGNNLNCGVGQPHPCVSEVVRSGDSSKPKTGIIAGVVAGVTVLLFWNLSVLVLQ
ncbi:hypothetical protein DY000_02025814 [Brassica cretica]|uniref:Leucine-rich repeat-containing N-terminal plant-type domain-containing protein n=1 Tax=Brassica cretica TaxID=69181 RepID=A0ABQ7ELC5_BRACR|nr:hypothetical protein DY000_02025814 [Brassica cretica]